MATITIDEGQAKEVPVADNLLYPNINSCLSLTAVFPDKKRVGGHAVMVPHPPAGQMDLQGICNYIFTRKGSSTGLYVIGYIQLWNDNWGDMDQTKNLIINGVKVKNVAGIATAMGYPAAGNLNFDVEVCGAPSGSYDVAFDLVSGNRVCTVKERGTGKVCPSFQNKTW